MKCFYCSEEAIVNLRYTNLRLYKKHFIEYFENRGRKTLERYQMLSKNKEILIAVSGGKDSVALLNVMSKLSSDYDIYIHGLTIDLGINSYKSYIRAAIENYRSLGVDYTIIDIKREYGFTIDDAVKVFKKRKPCSTCGIVKRYVINRFAYEQGFDSIATGHTLDDITALMLLHLLRGNLNELKKLVPVLESRERMVSRIKPLIETYENDIKVYVDLKSLIFDNSRCPYYSDESSLFYKKLLDKVENRSPSSKIVFLRSILNKIVPLIQTEEISLKKCKICGMPTTNRYLFFL